ncbi:MAG TPA: aminotransferase class I/II-fold pyridoxal phosphate-dependent enzyme [Chloroflexi bacterium]|nr:aminotransferase class I/II-fold pyridoxal phosphate-dependent enzyme [Chloroflexota bacterium]
MKINPFKLERYFAKYEFNVKYLLASSDCESLSIEDLLALEDGAELRFKEHWLGYTESQGSPALREEISRIYESLSPDQVLVHSGAEEAIFTFMQAALDPGDHLIVHWPCYQSLYEIAASMGCRISNWEARVENNWELDLDELKGLIQPNTKAIVINTPHNPTGYLMSRETYQETWQIAQSQGIILFCDEVYRESEYDPDDRLSAACDLGELGVSLGVMSKSYGLAGLRIGWIATQNADLYQKISHRKDYTSICCSAPSEFLAELALRHREKLAARNLEIITDNLALLDSFFDRHENQFSWIKPKAGPIAFPQLLGRDVDEFCHHLVLDKGVMLLPGTVYNHPGNHFRIGFGRQNMPEALAKLDDFIN